MADGTIQVHDGDTSDTLSNTCTPIVFVPGVMGSRLTLTDDRSWDPDNPLDIGKWPPLIEDGVRANRKALSITATPSGTKATTVFAVGLTKMCLNRGLLKIVKRELKLGWRPPLPGEVQTYYGTNRHWGEILWGFYGTILMRLETAFNATRLANPVYAYGYDFRKSNLDSGAGLISFVNGTVLANHPTAKQVVLVTHSMGGLVVRGAIASDGGFVDRVRGVVHGAQPSNGAVVCYTRFLSGATAPIEPTGFFDIPVSMIVGDDGHRFSYLMSGTVGPLQLLPNNKYQSAYVGGGKWLDGFGSGSLSDVFSIYFGSSYAGLPSKISFAQAKLGTDLERNSNSVVQEFATNLANARDFHDTLANAPNNGFHPHTIALYSSGTETMDSVRVNLGCEPDLHDQYKTRAVDGGTEVTDTWAQIAYVRKKNGDGTVPDVSARCPGATNVVVEMPIGAVKHADVYGNETFNNRVVFFVTQLLQGPPSHAENDPASTDEQYASNDSQADDSSGEVADDDPASDSGDASDGEDAVA